MNITCKVEKKANESLDEGPKALVYKRYGGNKYDELAKSFYEINSPLVQSMISYEMSRREWGPKLYGISGDVRIEEFVEGTTLSHSDAFQADLIQDTAKAFAQFHSLKLPLKKERVDLLSRDFFKALVDKEALAAWLNTLQADEATLKAYKSILDFPMEREFNWCTSIRDKVKNKFVFSTLDSNYLNRLVRKDRRQKGSTRVLIIDYDGSGYAHRGLDLGGHFANRMFDVSRKGDKMSGAPYPSESEREAFLTAYYLHLKNTDENFDESQDSLEHITLEADVYACVCCCFYVMFFHSAYKAHDAEPTMCSMCQSIIQLYWKLKMNLREKYPHLITDL